MQLAIHGVRKDTDELWRSSGVLEWSKLSHTPFIAITQTEGVINVHLIDSAKKAALLPEETPLLIQWKGQWRSDFFQTTAGEVKMQVEARNHGT